MTEVKLQLNFGIPIFFFLRESLPISMSSSPTKSMLQRAAERPGLSCAMSTGPLRVLRAVAAVL
jgi:hypothetical protein